MIGCDMSNIGFNFHKQVMLWHIEAVQQFKTQRKRRTIRVLNLKRSKTYRGKNMKINICMLLGIQYGEKMQIPPGIGIPSHITNFGHDVTWILPSKKLQKVQETSFNDIHVFLVPCGCSKCFTNKALYYYRKMYSMHKIFKQNDYNMIFVRSGIIDVLLALYLKKRYKIPFVIEMANPIEQKWEIPAVDSKYKYLWRFISKIGTPLAIQLLHKADLVIPISEWLMEDFANKKIKRSKMIAVPSGVDINRFSDTEGWKIREKYGLEDSKVVVYIGTMDKTRQLDVLIYAFSKVLKNSKNVKLLMVGDGTNKSDLEKLTNDIGIKDNVIFVGQIDFKEVPHFIDVANIGVSPVPPFGFYKLSSPIKMFEYMVMGKPVVANEEVPEQKKVIKESGGGILVNFDDESFASGIIKLLNDSERAKKIGESGHDWVLKNRSYDNIAHEVEKKYIQILKRQFDNE